MPGEVNDTEHELDQASQSEADELDQASQIEADDGQYLDSDLWEVNTTIGEAYKNLKQAFQSKFGHIFKKSWVAERDQLLNNGTSTRVRLRDVPVEKTIYRSNTTHIMKPDPLGPKGKSRWCLDGSSQKIPGVGFLKTATATARMSTVRMICAYSASTKLPTRQSDFPNR
jgi:hypothetical protein